MNVHELVVNRAFGPCFTTDATYIELMGGRGSGKSYFVFKQFLPALALGKFPLKFMAMRKVATSLRLSVWPAILDGLAEANLTRACKINKSDKEITLPNGSFVACAGADDPEKLKSLEGFDIVIKEEATEFDELDHLNIDAAIKSERKKIIDLYNPIPLTPNFSSYLKRTFWDVKHPDALTIKTTYRDNIRHLPKKYIDSLESLKITNPKLWDMWANGNYVALEGVIFENWDVVDAVPMGAKELGYGLDWGFSVDPTTLIRGWISGDDLYLREDIYQTELTNRLLIGLLHELEIDRTAEIIADNEDPKSIAEIHAAGFNIQPCTKGPDSVRKGIDTLQSLRIHLIRGSTNLIKEFQTYSWKKDRNGKALPVPADAWNHGIDAARYLAMRALGPRYRMAAVLSEALAEPIEKPRVIIFGDPIDRVAVPNVGQHGARP